MTSSTQRAAPLGARQPSVARQQYRTKHFGKGHVHDIVGAQVLSQCPHSIEHEAIAAKGWKKVADGQSDIMVILHGATQAKREATTFYSGGFGVHDGLATDHPTTVLSDTGAGSVTSQALKTAPSVFDSRAVVNLAVGGRTKYFTTNFHVANLGFVYFPRAALLTSALVAELQAPGA